MIEMRWRKAERGDNDAVTMQHRDDLHTWEEYRVLQYRSWIASVTTQGITGLPTGNWSEWQDVEVSDE